MSNLPPNPYNTSGPPSLNANAPQLNHNQSQNPLPAGQLPPGYGPLKQDANSNSPLPPSMLPPNSAIGQVNNYNQSANSSPAFNHSGMMPPIGQSSPMRPIVKPAMSPSNQNFMPPSASSSSPVSYHPNYQPRQINDNAPPLIPSSHSQPVVNGPPLLGPSPVLAQPASQHQTAGLFGPITSKPQVSSGFVPGPFAHQAPQGLATSIPQGTPAMSTMNVPFSGASFSGPQRSSPLVGGPSNPPSSIGQPQTRPVGVNGPSNISGPVSNIQTSVGPQLGPFGSGPVGAPVSGPAMAIRTNGPNPLSGTVISGPPSGPMMGGPPSGSVIGGPPNRNQISGPPSGPPMGAPPSGPQTGAPLSGPPMGLPPTGPQMSAPPSGPLSRPPSGPSVGGPASLPSMRGSSTLPPMGGPPSGPPGGPLNRPPMAAPSGPMSGPPTSGPPIGPPSGLTGSYGSLQKNGPGPASPPYGPPGGFPSGPTLAGHPMPPQQPPQGLMPPKPPQMGQPPTSSYPGPPTMPTNMQGRYPPMAPSNQFVNNQQPMPQPPQYGPQGLTQQMGQLSVTKQGFDQLWGHHMVDLLTCRQILPEYPEDPPEIRLANQFADAPNCSPEIFRCTVNRIPETNTLLQKSRLPLGIVIHPFKDLNHLPVIQCTTIVRCRACRTYINPFVYFVDAKRWKCNLCYRVNDLPEEFQYDPVSKSYGDPSRRPEIKSATIEFIAPGEYMLRPPQPAVYLFLMDVSQIARDSGYLQVLCDTLKSQLDQLPGDARTQVGFLCYDAHVHCYLMSDGLTRVKEMTVLDIDDVFLPSPESLLVNLGERRDMVRELLSVLPQRFAAPGPPASALGAALQLAYKLMAPTGGRVTVFQTCLPNVGPGALQSREDPNARSSAEVAHLSPATDFYKRLALDCSGAQVAVDLFLLNSQYADLATLSGVSKFSGGSVYHVPLYNSARGWQAAMFARMLTRYLTRKIGFEAVMRVRCTRGISIHTFHGNFFVRSTDLLSLPNVSPDAGFGMQLAIDESLSDLQQVCFQAALLYTSSKGERRIRVHTLALPIASNLTDVLQSADQQCIVGLLSKMAVDRCVSASMSEAREALTNVAIDALSAFRLSQNLPAGAASAALHAPLTLRLLPLYLLALLKRKAFRSGTSTRLDDRVSDMCDMKSLPLSQLLRAVYPDLYPVHTLSEHVPRAASDPAPDPPRLHLSAERINSNGAYLLDDGETMLLYVCHAVSPAFLSDTFGVTAFTQLPDEARTLPSIDSEGNELLHAFIDKLNDDRPYASNIIIMRDNSPNRQLFTERLVDDRVESAFAYYEFLQHIKAQVK